MAEEPWLLSDHSPAFKSKIQQSGTEKKVPAVECAEVKTDICVCDKCVRKSVKAEPFCVKPSLQLTEL